MRTRDYNYLDLVSGVELFNKYADNTKVHSESDKSRMIKHSIDRFKEESNEMVNAKTDVELLDAVADCFVTLIGLIDTMKSSGAPIFEAIKDVNRSNFTKIVLCEDSEVNRPNKSNLEFHLYDSKALCGVFRDIQSKKVQKPKCYSEPRIREILENSGYTTGIYDGI
jgi:hypothetical protein